MYSEVSWNFLRCWTMTYLQSCLMIAKLLELLNCNATSQDCLIVYSFLEMNKLFPFSRFVFSRISPCFHFCKHPGALGQGGQTEGVCCC